MHTLSRYCTKDKKSEDQENQKMTCTQINVLVRQSKILQGTINIKHDSIFDI